MARTLERIAEAGAVDFYRGDLARDIVADVRSKGGSLCLEDLAEYHAVSRPPLSFDYRDARMHVPAGLCAGPDLKATLDMTAGRFAAPTSPGPASYSALAGALVQAQIARLKTAGHAAEPAPTSTTAFCVLDRHGNMASVTQTLLSIFGAHTVGASTGLLMNNALMWFDPRAGHPNSLAPRQPCLMNICSTIGETPRGRFAVGASGGRKILSCVAHLTSFLVDAEMSLEDALHQPRVDTSLRDTIVADHHLPDDVLQALASEGRTVHIRRRGPHPYHFGVPSGIFDTGTTRMGCTEIHSPYGDAVAEP